MQTQQQAVDLKAKQALRACDRALTLVRQSGMVDTDPVDFVEFLLAGVTTRDLDAIADDIVCFVLQWDDLVTHVRDRLDVHLAFAESGHPADSRRAAENIVAAIRAIVCARVSRGDGR